MNVLCVHPPVYDFAFHDFWLKPHGLVKLAGLFHEKGAKVYYFDFLDRFSPDVEDRYQKSDACGKGKLPQTFIPKPGQFQLKNLAHSYIS